MYNTNAIKNYILLLKREFGLYVSLHPFVNESVITLSELISFNIHDNPYCVLVKTSDEAWSHCIARQEKVVARCREGSFCGKCFAGVVEFVYPIKNAQETVGFISVSGYRHPSPSSFLTRVSSEYQLSYESLRESYFSLKDELPQKEWVDSLIAPLCDMLELAYLKSGDEPCTEESLPDKILRYLKRYHTENITVESVAKKFGCSRSYVSHRFKKLYGKSFRELLNEMRIKDAASLLEHSSLSITEIALTVGYSDSAYFCGVFKAAMGLSPSAFRKSRKQ